jgi:hypothetical protein
MIKLLSYKRDEYKLTCNFEKEQWVKFYTFGDAIMAETSDGIEKSAIKNIKQKLNKEGLNCKLDEFINQEFYEYFEENSYGYK